MQNVQLSQCLHSQVEVQNAEYEERGESLRQLENSVRELNSLFVDVAQLVKDAQPMIGAFCVSFFFSYTFPLQTTSSRMWLLP